MNETYVVMKAYPGHKVGDEVSMDPAAATTSVAEGYVQKRDAAAVAEVEGELDALGKGMAGRLMLATAKHYNAGLRAKGASPFALTVPEDFGTHAEAKDPGSMGEILQAIGLAVHPSYQGDYSKALDILTNKYGENGLGAVTISKTFGGDFAKASRMDGAVAKSGQSEGQGSAGGFAVAPTFSETFFELLYPKSVLLSEVVRRVMTGIDYYEPTWDYSLGGNGVNPYLAGMSGGWVPENGALAATTATIRQFHLKADMFGALNVISRQLLFDAPRLQSMLMEKFAQVAAFYLTQAIFSGDGIGKPKGFTNAACAYPVTRTATPGNGDLLADLSKVFAKRLPDEGSTNRLFWMVSPSAEQQLITLNDKSGKVVFLPNFPGTAGGPATARVPMTLFGIPVVRSQFPAAYGTATDFVLIDPSAYILAMRQDLEVAASMHVNFTTNQIVYRFLMRGAGDSPVNKYLTLANNDIVSPFPYLS